MEPMLQFFVMVDSEMSRERMIAGVLEAFPEARPHKAYSCDIRGNLLQVVANRDADPSLADDPEDGFLYFTWEVDCIPQRGDLDEDHQLVLARDLQRHFAATGARTAVGASFEDRLQTG
ncbi:hypothetical protein [Actinoplanes siamensis]|uniref:Uncharacterized protein n=1 Tax=Actinoplanes siamensis TaxID=1223317 RepID=A0A919NBJ7_9ACTN|nr:hypothetical protein [Actinoplanes siamensis]GIF07832.1 hypothetical protein Asi03nite_53700 [Actinoplanes siamensis]